MSETGEAGDEGGEQVPAPVEAAAPPAPEEAVAQQDMAATVPVDEGDGPGDVGAVAPGEKDAPVQPRGNKRRKLRAGVGAIARCYAK